MNTPHQIVADIIDAAAPPLTPEPPSQKTMDHKTLVLPPIAEEQLSRRVLQCCAFDQSDTDNGKRLRTYFSGDILVMLEKDTAGGAFLVWNGKYWDLGDGVAAATRLAQRVGDLVMREADMLAPLPGELERIRDGAVAQRKRDAIDSASSADLAPEQLAEIRRLEKQIAAGQRAREALYRRKTARHRFGVSSKNAARINAMLNCAAPHLRREPEAFNADPYAVATESHTLHFVRERDEECPDPAAERFKWHVEAREGHDRSDMITALIPVKYDPAAFSIRWEHFLDRFMPVPEHTDKRRTLQQYCGVSLLGVLMQYVMYHYGLGANGKSVFLETLMRVLGPSFAVSLPPETLVGKAERGAGQASPDIVRLFGKRMLRVPELAAGKPLQESLIKQITGGEQITARTLFKGYVDFPNRAKPHMSGNGFPTIDGTDDGIWRRMLVMHWTETIIEGERKNLEDVVALLMAEASGILNWLIAGALDYLNSGFLIAPSVRAATQDYRDEMDTIGQFIRDCIEPYDGETVTARTLFNAYLSWAAANAKRPVTETKFGRVMKTRFRRRNDRVRVYLDIRLHDIPTLSADNAPPINPADIEF